MFKYCFIDTHFSTSSYERAKKERIVSLRDFFYSYGLEFIDDLDACINAVDQPETLIKYFQNMSKRNRNAFRSTYLRENEVTGPELMDVIVENLQFRNSRGKNWIIVNAPLDFRLMKKMYAADLFPIQMVFFHDSDPEHQLLLGNKMSNIDRDQLIRDTFENVKNGIRYGCNNY